MERYSYSVHGETKMEKFHELVKDQFIYGGKKYNITEKTGREGTDELVDDFGIGWLFGTMGKYVKRYANFPRERDLLKMGCYCYLLWIKKGYFLKIQGFQVDMVDTNIELKESFFGDFKEEANTYITDLLENDLIRVSSVSRPAYMSLIYQKYKDWNREGWANIKRGEIFWVYAYIYIVWKEEFGNIEKHDTDTKNEEETKK